MHVADYAEPAPDVLSRAGAPAARAAGVPVVGYANKPGKVQRIADAGAGVVVTGMAEIAAGLGQLPV